MLLRILVLLRGGGCNNIHLAICGQCYNLTELNSLFKTSFATFFDIILHTYKENRLSQLLNKVDGCFTLFLYDASKEKIILANDRFGLNHLYFYTHNGTFTFSSNVTPLLSLDFVDKTINEKAFEMFMNFGHFLGSHTWFKYIKRLPPATLLEFHIATKKISQRHYWTFAEVKQQNISLDNAVDMAYELFKDAIKRQVDLKLYPSILMSGGSDSRLCLATMNEIYPHYKPHTATFGVKNCLDFILAQKACNVIGIKNKEALFENIDWLDLRKMALYGIDCSHSLLDLHGCEFILFPKDSKLCVSGFLGDAVFGDSYVPQKRLYNQKINFEIAEYYYKDFAQFCDWQDEYYNIENPLPLHWINRGVNFINMAVSSNQKQFVCRPFFDNKIIELIVSLPNEYLAEYKFYKNLVLKHYAKFFKYIGRNSLMPLYLKKDFTYFINKMKLKLYKKCQKKGFVPKIIESYTNYDEWVMQEPIKTQISKYLSSKNAFYRKFPNEILNLWISNKKDDYADRILKLVSMEIYFEKVGELLRK